MKNLTFILLLVVSVCFSACKKDKLEVDQEKVFLQVNARQDTTPGNFSIWSVTLRTDGTADILPSGDIVYRGKYDIKGSSLKIETDQNDFNFDIISDTEIKNKEYGVTLKLKEN